MPAIDPQHPTCPYFACRHPEQNHTARGCALCGCTNPPEFIRRNPGKPARLTCPGCGHGYGYHDDNGCHHDRRLDPDKPFDVRRCYCTRTGVSLHSGQLTTGKRSDDWPSAAESTANSVNVVQLVRDLTNPNECWYDHHGYCLAHGWLKAGECPHARAKRLLRGQP